MKDPHVGTLKLYLEDKLEPIENQLSNTPTGRCKGSKRYDRNNREIPEGEELPTNIIARDNRPKKLAEENSKIQYLQSEENNTDIIHITHHPTITMSDLLCYSRTKNSPDHNLKLSGDSLQEDSA